MVNKGWTGRTATAAGVAAGTGAAQLGLGYGLGVVVWPTEAAIETIWLGSLGWATWIAATSAVIGAVVARRLNPGTPAGSRTVTRRRGPWRLALATAAAVGALLTVALIAVPARAAVRADTSAPQVVAAGYAVVGVLLGLIMAYWAVVSRPVAANIVATVGWIWTLAVAALVQGLITGHAVVTTHVGGWQFTGPGDGFRYGTVYWPGAVLTLVAAFLIGVLAARSAARRGEHGIGAAASGAAGPLLVAAAFFVLAPQLTSAVGQLQSAYLMAPYAVLAGLAGSAATVAAGQRLAARTGSPPVPSPPVASPPPSSPPPSPVAESAAYPLASGPSSATTSATGYAPEGASSSVLGSAASAPPASTPPDSATADASRGAASGVADGGAMESSRSVPSGSGAERRTITDRAERRTITDAASGPTADAAAASRPIADAGSGPGRTADDPDDATSVPPTAPPSRAADRPATATGRAKLPRARTGGTAGSSPGARSATSPAVPAAADDPPARPTVTAPPTTPVVAQINPPVDGPGSEADTDGSGPRRRSAERTKAGAKSANTGPSDATTTQKNVRPSTGGAAGAAKANRGDPVPEDPQATPASAPLWVDDDGPADQQDEHPKSRLRGFGRRPSKATGSGSKDADRDKDAETGKDG